MSVRCTGGDRRRHGKLSERKRPGPSSNQLRERLATVLALVWMLGPVCARAQTSDSAEPSALPPAVVLATAGADASDAGLDSVIHAALEKLGVVNVTARPGMDLSAIQIALDCVGETPRCLRAVAVQNSVQILVAPAIERTGEELIVTLLYFDARGEGELRRVARRQGGGELKPETLDAVPEMLRELFQVTKPTAEAPAPVTSEEGREAPPPPQRVPVGPLILGGAGVLVVAGGVVAGLMMQSTQSDYTALTVKDMKTLTQAHDKASKGKNQAAVANVLYGVGAAAIAASAIWLALELTHRDQEAAPQTAVVPWLGPTQAGLALVHRGGAL